MEILIVKPLNSGTRRTRVLVCNGSISLWCPCCEIRIDTNPGQVGLLIDLDTSNRGEPLAQLVGQLALRLVRSKSTNVNRVRALLNLRFIGIVMVAVASALVRRSRR